MIERVIILANENFKLPKLFAHNHDDYVVIVPNELRTSTRIWLAIIRSPLFSVWAMAIGIFTLARKMLRHLAADGKPSATMGSILFDTIGLTFGTTSGVVRRIKNRPERVLVLFLTLVAMLAAIMCPGHLFEELSTVSYRPKINTFDELKRSNMGIMVPSQMDDVTIDWLNKT